MVSTHVNLASLHGHNPPTIVEHLVRYKNVGPLHPPFGQESLIPPYFK